MKTEIPSCSECGNKTSIFCSLSEEDDNLLSESKGDNFYKKGQAIFYEGNQSHGLYCVHKGKIKLSKLGEGGKEQVLRFAKTGNILGYRALFNNESYQATAVAMEDSYICHLSKESFVKLMNRNPDLLWKAMLLLSQDLKHAEQHVLNIAQKTVKERIIETIILLHDVFGFMEDGVSLDVCLTRTEIADVAGTTTETAIRTLAALKKLGVINLKGKTIVIPSMDALVRENCISAS